MRAPLPNLDLDTRLIRHLIHRDVARGKLDLLGLSHLLENGNNVVLMSDQSVRLVEAAFSRKTKS